jgi:hypothetical protein
VPCWCGSPTLLLGGVSIVQIRWIISVISLAPMVGTALLMLASVSVRAFLMLFWTIPSAYYQQGKSAGGLAYRFDRRHRRHRQPFSRWMHIHGMLLHFNFSNC